MFGRIGTAIRFFLIGLGVGLLTAPRSGRATRQQIQQRAVGWLESVSGGRAIEIARPAGQVGEAPAAQPTEAGAMGTSPTGEYPSA